MVATLALFVNVIVIKQNIAINKKNKKYLVQQFILSL